MYEKLMREAKELYDAAMALREQFAGNDVPADAATKINEMLDQVEAKRDQANTIKRMNSMGPMFQSDPMPITSGGQEPEYPTSPAILNAGVKGLGNFVGVQELPVTPFNVEDARGYDPDRMAKHYLATLLFWKYGEKNFDKVLRSLPKEFAPFAAEMKDLATSQGATGGYLVADTLLARVVEIQASSMAMRRLATVLPPIPGGSTIFPSEESALSDPEWTTEVGTGSDDTVAPFGQKGLTPHPIAKRIKISRTLLRAAGLLDVEAWVLNRLARKFNYSEENAFINGTGAQQPEGLLVNSGISSVSTAASNTLGADDIINWAYSLGDAYAARAQILCNRSFIRKVRLLKGTDNNYLWQPGLAQGSPPTILDWAYNTSDFYPTGLTADAFDDNALVATIGDFSFYWVVDSLNFEVQRLEELYAASNQVGFIGRKETDGMVVDSNAFVHLKILA